MQTELSFLFDLQDIVDTTIEDTYEESIKYSRLKTLKRLIEERIEKISLIPSTRMGKLLKLHKFTDQERDYLLALEDKAEMLEELADPYYESREYKIKDNVYRYTREAFINYEGTLNYGYTIYVWTGNYIEKPLGPKTKKTFKFKEWNEIFHGHGDKKYKGKDIDFLKEQLELRETLIDISDKGEDAQS